MKKGFRVGLILTAAVFVGACNMAYADAIYDVTTQSELNSALTYMSGVAKTINLNSNINLTGNLATPIGTTFTINGFNHNIDGGGKAGFIAPDMSTLTINDTTMSNFASADTGGAINTMTVPGSYSSDANINIYNSVFKSNTATGDGSYGGAIYNEIAMDGAYGNLNIYNSTFGGELASDGNTAQYGGAIYNYGTINVYNSSFINNAAAASSGNALGGAIHNSMILKVYSSVFRTNKAISVNNPLGSYGGAICNEADLIVRDSTFGGDNSSDGNTAAIGGAIYNNTGGINISDSIFKNNSAVDGGAIYNNYGTSNIYNSTFEHNSATDGGAIYNNNYGTTTVFNSTFENNSATNGGSIYNDTEGVVNIYNSTFENNSATNGGVLYNNSIGDMAVFNTEFIGNAATWGGVIYNAGSSNIYTYNSTFKNNTSFLGAGGAIYNEPGCVAKIYDSTFGGTAANEGNIAARGGAIYNNAGTVNIYNSAFTNNKVIAISGSFSSAYGGAIYNYFGSTLTINSSTFKGNTLTKYLNNSAYGGAIYNAQAATVSNSIFGGEVSDANTADKGGAICNVGALTVTNSTFKNNGTFAGVSNYWAGGAIANVSYDSIKPLNTATITNSTFINNTAYTGGAIYSNADSRIYDTYPTGSTISNSTFKGNAATGNGGAIAYGNYSIATISNSVFGGTTAGDANTAASGGAILNSGILTITNSKFINNTASTVNGGGIYGLVDTNNVAEVGLNLVALNGNVEFTGNKANGVSNAITMDSSSGASYTNLNLNAKGGEVIINDAIISLGASNVLNINKTGTGIGAGTGLVLPLNVPTSGVIVLNNALTGYNTANSSVNLFNTGALRLGSYIDNSNHANDSVGSIGTSGSRVLSFTMSNSAILDLANGRTNDSVYINAFTATGTPSIWTDINLATVTADKININSGSGTVYFKTFKLAGNTAGSTTVNVITSAGTKPTINAGAVSTYTNDYTYTVTSNSANGTLTFAQGAQVAGQGYRDAIASAQLERSVSLTGNYVANANAVTPVASSALTIFGNNKLYSISGNANTYSLLSTNTTTTLNIFDTVLKESISAVVSTAGAVTSLGTTNIYNSEFINNVAVTSGAISNSGTSALEVIPTFRRTASLPDKVENGEYVATAGALGLTLINIKEDINDMKSAGKQIYSKIDKDYHYDPLYTRATHQHSFSFTRGMVGEKLLHEKLAEGNKIAETIYDMDKTIDDTKFGKAINNFFKTEKIDSKSIGEIKNEAGVCAKAVQYKSAILGGEITARAMRRTTLAGVAVVAALELPKLIKETTKGGKLFDHIENGAKQTIKSTVNAVSTTAGIAYGGAIGAKYAGATGSLIGMGIGAIAGNKISNTVQNVIC